VDRVNAVEDTVEIRNRLGLHLRAASTLAQSLKPFESSVTLTRGRQHANAKSVTSMIMLGAGSGTKLKVKVEGPDADEALAALREQFEQGFGEE
jgi:phosphotransferase system HPr (HPr) family protein